MAKRPLQEINAGSMADIAFLLLIFFLVTTTMSTNTGMQRRLPPMPEDPNKDEIIEIKERNVMVVLVNRDNNIAIKGKPILLKDVYKKAKDFFENPYNDENLPEKEPKDIPFFGQMYVTKGVISLQTDRNTNYEKYLHVQNELVRAVNDLRDEISKLKFGMPFDDLDDDKQEAVGDIYPLAISEAEPRRMTGAGGN